MSIYENKIICSKKHILLTLDNNKNYNLNFNTISNNFDFKKYINFDIYKLLFQLNKDIVESIEIIDQLSDNQANILIIFKEIGDSIKIPKNYIYLTINKSYINKEIIFESTNNNDITKIQYKINGLNKTICEHSILKINNHNNILIFNYNFKFNILSQQSTFINNIIALLIKKVFYKLKLFIEKSINNNNDLP
tara:strand:- start:18 stop:596 length:579 start_codon:yes stop_codon:yes gene_type:complete